MALGKYDQTIAEETLQFMTLSARYVGVCPLFRSLPGNFSASGIVVRFYQLLHMTMRLSCRLLCVNRLVKARTQVPTKVTKSMFQYTTYMYLSDKTESSL